MSWRDRDESFDDNPMRRYGRPGGDWQGLRPTLDNPMTWSLPLMRVLGISVRVHAVFLIYIVIQMLLAVLKTEPTGLGVAPTFMLLTCLFGVVLMHEFGHCLACRWSGGAADEILMWPLGGLAYCRPTHRWVPHLITAAGGPMVNVVLLAVLIPTIGFWTGQWWGVAIANPLVLYLPLEVTNSWPRMALYMLNQVSLILLLFNLLPVFPLDGGRIMQAVLWRSFGYARSMRYAVRVGYVGAIGLGIMGFVTQNVMLVCIAVFGGITCWITHRQLQFTQEMLGFDSDDYSASLYGPDEPDEAKKAPSRRQQRDQRRARREREEASTVDGILQKIAARGMQSLSGAEKRRLRRATRRRKSQPD